MKNLLLACICLFWVSSVAIAQKAKNKKHEKAGLAWELPATWELSPEKNSDTRFYAYPTSGGQAKMEVRAVEGNTSEDAAKATVTFMQESNIEPSLIKDVQPRTVKKGNLAMQIFEKDYLDMKLGNGTELYRNQKLMLANHTKTGKKYIVYLVEIYEKPSKHTEAFNIVIKTLKAK